jgi:hypothetical protein
MAEQIAEQATKQNIEAQDKTPIAEVPNWMSRIIGALKGSTVFGIIAGSTALSLVAFAGIPTFGLVPLIAIVVAGVIIGGASGGIYPKTTKNFTLAAIVGFVAGGIVGGFPGALMGGSVGLSLDGTIKTATRGRFSIHKLLTNGISYVGSGLQRAGSALAKTPEKQGNLSEMDRQPNPKNATLTKASVESVLQELPSDIKTKAQIHKKSPLKKKVNGKKQRTKKIKKRSGLKQRQPVRSI